MKLRAGLALEIGNLVCCLLSNGVQFALGGFSGTAQVSLGSFGGAAQILLGTILDLGRRGASSVAWQVHRVIGAHLESPPRRNKHSLQLQVAGPTATRARKFRRNVIGIKGLSAKDKRK
jgi:hypothetical protein